MIRPATPLDAPGIAAIWNLAIRETTVTFNPVEKTHAEIAAMIGPAEPCLVSEQAGQIMGFARYFPFRTGLGYAHTVEHTILLRADAQGQGIGRALIDHLAAHATAAGKHSMLAVISGENPAGIAFHAACGFTMLARMPQVGFKFGRWLDAVFMQRFL